MARKPLQKRYSIALKGHCRSPHSEVLFEIDRTSPGVADGMQDRRKDETGRVIVAAMAALGMAAGLALGSLLAAPLAELHLKSYLSRVTAQEIAAVKEGRDLLEKSQKSAYPPCSEAELAHFRELLFRSEYLRDVGRIHKGAIDCSATAGRPTHPIGQFKAAATQADGLVSYSNLVPIHDENLKRAGLQLGSTFVVFGEDLPIVEGSLPFHLSQVPAVGVSSDSDQVRIAPQLL